MKTVIMQTYVCTLNIQAINAEMAGGKYFVKINDLE